MSSLASAWVNIYGARPFYLLVLLGVLDGAAR
jgi:hypothetical protein